MISSILLLLGAALAYGVYKFANGLVKNIAAAKRANLPYYVVPVSPFNRIGQATATLWLPIFQLLPRKYWQDIITVLKPDWQYHENHKIYATLGETFLVVAPGQIIMYTDNAEVIHQITSKREAFPKPTEAYSILSQYGDNVVTTEGAVWRMHRKVTSASFNEKNAALVFEESINQTQGLVRLWLGPDGKGNRAIKTLEHDTMALMLHIIGYIGFGLTLLWPGETMPADADPKLAKYSTLDAPKGYTMSFIDSLANTLHYIILLLLSPGWLLRALPFKTTKKAAASQDNFIQYMNDFLQDKIDDVKKGNKEQGMDIMGQLVRSSYGDKGASAAVLKDDEIIGNAFIMLVAGHETTANVLHFTMAELANNPMSQRLVQKDVDKIFGDAEPQTWDYESSVNALMASMVAAAMNESLRTVPPVTDIPKKVAQDQTITIDGESHMLPRGSHIGLTVAAVQRNPRYWPSKPSKITGAETDIDDWVPERWYRTASDESGSATVEGADDEDFGGFAGPDTSAQMFRPVRGSYIPFSDGARSCLGRRIAQVEMVATLSVIFQKYSVELDVQEWASDAEVARMSRAEKAALYRKAQDRSRQVLKGATSLITLKLHGDNHVPVRLVKRGEERFVDWAE